MIRHVLALAGALVLAVPALADDASVAAGKAVVEMYCADCHATGPSGESRLAIAPLFRELYLRYNVEDLSEALVEGIVTAHPEMPEFEFDPEQAQAIVDYLKSLEPAGSAATEEQ